MSDDLLNRIANADPSQQDRPPLAGTDRFESIAATARQMAGLPPRPSAPSAVPGSGWRAVALVAGICVAVFVASMLRTSSTPSAAAALREAAAATAAVDSFRYAGELTRSDGSQQRMEAEGSGGDVRVTVTEITSEGTISVETFTLIDNTIWSEIDGVVTRVEEPPNERLPPFDESSAAVVAALLSGDAEVTVADTPTGAARYEIEIDDPTRRALEELTPQELYWFALNRPREVEAVTVEVAEQLIHRIEVETPTLSFDLRFFDFNTRIDIRAPD